MSKRPQEIKMDQLIIISGAEVYSPEKCGKKDILVGGGKILAVDDEIRLNGDGVYIKRIDADGLLCLPGFVDSHVHICGGGGEGGFASRTPEIQLSSIIEGGITSQVGVLGTDGTTRTMSNLIAKARGLTEEGIDTWVLTGSYQFPPRTVTGSVTDDIILIQPVVGTGEIALSDHRSSHPSLEELIRLVSDARLGGMLSGKAGIVDIHLGDGSDGMKLLRELIENSDLPYSQLQPTHTNRNLQLFEEAVEYAKNGGYVDFTTSTTALFIEEGEIPAAEALKRMLESGIPVEQVTFSTDAQGSLPQFDKEGNLMGLTTGKSSSLLEAFREAVLDMDVPLEEAVRTLSTNPADRFLLPSKGRIEPGFDADILLLDKDKLQLHSLYAKGECMAA